MSKISRYVGTKIYHQQVKHPQKWSWKDCTSQNAGFCSASDRVGFVWPSNRSKQLATELSKLEGVCETSDRSDDENSKLQSPE